MTAASRTRVAVLAALLGVLFALCVGYGTLEPNPAHGRFPGVEEVVSGERSYEGRHVALRGEIVATAPVTLEAESATIDDGSSRLEQVRFTVIDGPRDTRVGQQVEVFGVLTDDRTIRAQNVVLVQQRNISLMYLVSALAGLWVLARIIRDWRLQVPTLTFHRRRTHRRSHKSTATRTFSNDSGGDDDA